MKGKIVLIILNVCFLLILLFSLMIYTSTLESVAWQESCGMQFMAIFIMVDPILLIVGVALHYLGKQYSISKFNRLLPFVAIAGLSLPLFGALNFGISIGLPINIILCLLVFAEVVRSVLGLRKSE